MDDEKAQEIIAALDRIERGVAYSGEQLENPLKMVRAQTQAIEKLSRSQANGFRKMRR